MDKQHKPIDVPETPLLAFNDNQCALDSEGYCATCSDEARPFKVLRVDQETGMALVEVQNTTEEIDITLVEAVAPGDIVLVHGGVAIGKYATP